MFYATDGGSEHAYDAAQSVDSTIHTAAARDMIIWSLRHDFGGRWYGPVSAVDKIGSSMLIPPPLSPHSLYSLTMTTPASGTVKYSFHTA